MQVGDLVTLSAAGNKNKGNDLVRGKMGVIVEISERPEVKYPINIRWFNIVGLYSSGDTLRMKRYEIKKV
tara:strand:- start:1431 stop:1640 length:210 start_codon:yes stop_codon:yes gene_type:complete